MSNKEYRIMKFSFPSSIDIPCSIFNLHHGVSQARLPKSLQNIHTQFVTLLYCTQSKKLPIDRVASIGITCLQYRKYCAILSTSFYINWLGVIECWISTSYSENAVMAVGPVRAGKKSQRFFFPPDPSGLNWANVSFLRTVSDGQRAVWLVVSS